MSHPSNTSLKRLPSCLIAMAVFVLCLSPAWAQTAGDRCAELVRGAVARSEAVFSGRIEFRQSVYKPGASEPTWVKSESFYFSGTSWAVTPDGWPEPKEVCHRGKYVFHSTSRRAGENAGHTAQMLVEQPINAQYPRLPLFQGRSGRGRPGSMCERGKNRPL